MKLPNHVGSLSRRPVATLLAALLLPPRQAPAAESEAAPSALPKVTNKVRLSFAVSSAESARIGK
jgi:hypothetical protein